MTSGMPNENRVSVESTEMVAPPIPDENPVADNGIPPIPRPVRVNTESRDVSVCSRNTRDSLRRNVSMRCNTFTESERLFLEQLTVDGTDEDVERALQTVEDQDLFFEHSSSPRHLEQSDSAIGLNINPSTSSAPDDATRDAEAASVATSERRGLDKVATNSLTTPDDGRRCSSSSSSTPQIPSNILGSERRQQVLQRRRSDASLNMANLWKAHETGLAITSLGSQKSLLRRESSISSIGSNMSGLSVLFGNRPHPGATEQDVFRADGGGKNAPNKGRPERPIPAPRPFARPMIPRSRLHRSKSITIATLNRNFTKTKSKPSGLSNKQRAKSFSKRRSVTFHSIDEELEFDKNLESTAITPGNAVETIPKRSQIVRRAVSDSNIANSQEPGEEDASGEHKHILEREVSTSSIPSLHHGTPIRQDSISSIPSLHHGNPLRDSMSIAGQSTSSIPSLHQANPLGDSMSVMGQSISSIPSLHQAIPVRDSLSTIRRDSTASATTFASLRPANPLRQESTTSFPSLHHGNPVRQESMSSFPSIHYGKPIRQDSVASSIAPDAMTQDQITRQFGVTDEIAAAWIQLSSSSTTVDASRNRSLTSSTTQPSLSDDLELPSAPTAPTISTALDAGENVDGATATTADSSTDDASLLTSSSTRQAISRLVDSRPKPVFLRQASQNVYEGEGVEVTELDDRPIEGTLSETDSYYYPYQQDNSVFRTASLFSQNYGSIRTAGSFDDVSFFSTYGQQQQTSEVFRDIRRSLSDDNLSHFIGQDKEFLLQIPASTDFTMTDTFVDDMSDDGCSTGWEMESGGRFDAWNILQDEYANGYGGAGTLGFKILGTSAADIAAQPHVLSPPLMESLQAFLPPTKSGENFFIKYSMIRDGASLQTLLKRARGIQYSILAVETIDGEVFGSFTGQAWRKSWNYFGTGESFLWRMRHSRLDGTNGILDQAQKESEIDVYPYTGENDFIQLCTHDRIAVGGGMPEEVDSAEKKTQTEPFSNPLVDHDHDWGLGLALRSDLLQGSSSPCLTFGSPSLYKSKPSGERFEVVNVELWAMTPCATEEEAEKLELGKLFLGSEKGGRNSLGLSYTY